MTTNSLLRRILTCLAAGALALALATPVAQAQPGSASASASAKGCAKHLSKSKRAKRGSAKQKKLKARYRACKRKAAKKRAPAAPAPQAQPQQPVGKPNPKGFSKTQLCQVENETEYNAAGFTCQMSGMWSEIYNAFTGGYNRVPIYVLFERP